MRQFIKRDVDFRNSRRRRWTHRLLKTSVGAVVFAAVIGAAVCISAQSDVANRPYKTFDTTPAILAGPLVLDVSDTSAVLLWMTDSPSDARVRFGEQTPEHEVIPDEDGLVPVGTMHRVVLEGLKPGTRYRYQAFSRRVVAMKPYWPDRGGTAESRIAEFTTLDPAKSATRFAVVTDTHDDPARVRDLLAKIGEKGVEFVVHAGDSMDHATSERQVRDGFFAPMAEGLAGLPMLYVRGNHETRGEFARTLAPWLRAQEGHYYYERRQGPLHLYAIDSGEDKSDATRVYAELNNMRAYRERELVWFRETLRQPVSPPAAFRVMLTHQPEWGWTGMASHVWSQQASDAGIDLMISGHNHRHSWIAPGSGKTFPTLVVGQDQFAVVDVNTNRIQIEIFGRDGRPQLKPYSVTRK